MSRAEFPAKFRVLFDPARYKVFHGGRGGAKSWAFARALLIKGAERKLRVLCVRELQTSIRESVHQLLSNQITLLGLDRHYSVQQSTILGTNGAEFIFSGVRNNTDKIKSYEDIDICWVEEAQKLSEDSWTILIPTIRKEGSEIWASFNPDLPTDPTYVRFITNPPPDAVVVEVNWRDNPWFSEVLRREKDYLARVDKDAYDWVWEGLLRKRSKGQVLSGKCTMEYFEPGKDWDGPYQGIDWGFANDPSVFVRLWIHNRRLYVHREAYGVGVELDDLPELFDRVTDAKKYVSRADNSRPETISHVKRKGYPRVEAAEKWPGSVEDGIAFLRSFEAIVIHPDCRHTEEESRLYSYKVDRLTGDVLPEIVDRHNHCIDAIRYALEPMIKQAGVPGIFFVGAESAPAQGDPEAGGEIRPQLTAFERGDDLG